MDTTTPSNLSISRTLVPDHLRMEVVDMLFGINFPLRLEPCIFNTASSMVDNYSGAYWDFFQLCNGGFYMAPSTHDHFHLSSPNGFTCELSGDAVGLVCCLFSFSMLSFEGDAFAQTCAKKFHELREYIFEHAECGSILQAID